MMHPSTEGHRVHLRSLVRQEQTTAYKRHDYLSYEWQLGLWRDEVKETMQLHEAEPRLSPSSVTALVDSDGVAVLRPPSGLCVGWRDKIIEWKYQVVDRFDLDRELVSVSTFYLDQYLSIHYVDAELFQLVSMVCIYLAIKIHSPKKISIDSIVSTGNGLITAQHIEAMELSIMKCLNWHLFPPTANAFIENVFPILAPLSGDDDGRKAVADALEFSRFLAELSVCAYPFACARPSSVALAAVLYSLEVCEMPLREGEEDRVAALHQLVQGTEACAPEVEACGRLLRRVYQLAQPGDAAD